jgi:poly [ADP-ribose] polymerase
MENKELIFTDVEKNSNKFITITPNPDKTFTVTWGRIGTAGSKTTYPESRYDSYLREKLKKGYRDDTEEVKSG